MAVFENQGIGPYAVSGLGSHQCPENGRFIVAIMNRIRQTKKPIDASELP